MPNAAATVFIIDDDASVRRALQRLIKAANHQVHSFASAREFLDKGQYGASLACLCST